jgi:hypothetical protein
MVYYTIYIRGLNNGTGYIDIALEDDQLLKDYKQYLDVNVRSTRAYTIVQPSSQKKARKSHFCVSLQDITALTFVTDG